jgi:hypothetical protein
MTDSRASLHVYGDPSTKEPVMMVICPSNELEFLKILTDFYWVLQVHNLAFPEIKSIFLEDANGSFWQLNWHDYKWTAHAESVFCNYLEISCHQGETVIY